MQPPYHRPKITWEHLVKNWTGTVYPGMTVEESIVKAILDSYENGGADVHVKNLIARNTPITVMSDDLWYRWLQEEPTFSSAVHRGRLLAQEWWMNKGREHLVFRQGQGYEKMDFVGYNFQMKNRFGWTDKNEVTGKDGQNLFSKVVVEIVEPKNNGTQDTSNERTEEDFGGGAEGEESDNPPGGEPQL